MTDAEASDPEVVFGREGALGTIVLNRPKALNALNLDMVLALAPQLAAWRADDSVGGILIKGAGERAFCAGGDIRALYDSGRGDGNYARQFYHDEYRLNAALHHLTKPYTAFLDGITMGGGVGLSVHGPFRVATENVVFAMPESGIGLFPDVGGSYFLPRLPGEIGMYLALTGHRLRAADVLHAGVATHFVPHDELPALERALVEAAGADAPMAATRTALDRFARDPGAAPLAEHRVAIDRHFAHDSLEAIAESLAADPGDWARDTLAVMRTKSPITMKVTFRQLREGRKLDFDDCMRMEYRLASRFIEGRDFYEGVRATVIDKDQKPRWDPARWEDVSDADVAAYFAPLGARELVID